MSRRYNNGSSFPWGALIVLIAVVVLLATFTTTLSDMLPATDDNKTNNDQQSSTTTPDECKHTNRTFEYVLQDANGHKETVTCKDCGKVISEKVKPHELDADGKCEAPGCAYACSHDAPVTIKYTSAVMNKHNKNTCCSACGAVLNVTLENHSFEDGVCTQYGCGYVCVHTGEGLSYTHLADNDESHIQNGLCTNCGKKYDAAMVEHIYVNGVCSKCKHTCKHTGMEETYQNNGAGTHTVIRDCPFDCGLSEREEVACTFDASTGLCTVCKGGHTHIPASYTLEFDDSRRTNTSHARQTACTLCNFVFYVEEAHNFSGNSCPCGFCCEHQIEYAYISGGGDHRHVTVEKCSICTTVFSRTEEFCTDYETVTRYIAYKDGHVEVLGCSVCGGEYIYGDSPHKAHEFEICGACKYCGVYSHDAPHYNTTYNGGTCIACGHPADSSKIYD